MVRNRLWQLLGLLTIAGFAYACLMTVPQHSNSGSDYKWKKAKAIKLDESGEGNARGIVTYPGGDRVDWKVVEMPANGSVKLRLSWRPPRPGLDLAFSVYDQYLKRVGRAKPSPGKNRRSKRIKLRSVEKGKYYIQIYAPRRTDAGKYKLNVRFKKAPPGAPDAGPLDIPNPPRLAAIPALVDASPKVDAPPPPDGRLAPVAGNITGMQKVGNVVRITINRGKNAGISRGMKGFVTLGAGKTKLPGGEFVIFRVRQRYSIANVKLTLGQVQANPNVLIER